MYYRMQLTIDEIEYILGYDYIDAKTIYFEIKHGFFELAVLNAALTKNLEVEANEKFVKTVLTTKYYIIFNTDPIEVLDFTIKSFEAATHLGEKNMDENSVDKVHLIFNCVEGSLVNGKRESILFLFTLDARPGYESL